MKFGIIQGIAHTRAAKDRWKDAGGIWLRADRTPDDFRSVARRMELDFILNMGNTSVALHNQDIPVINDPVTIKALVYPECIRTKLPELAPPRPTDFSQDQLVWVKAPGQRGKGKSKVWTSRPLVLPDDWDWQGHIEGDEYRVITVGRRAVQAFHRTGYNGDREYNWTGLTNTPDDVLRVARKATRYFDSFTKPHNIMYAWDLIKEHETGNVYLFEGNTAPATNEHSIQRITSEIQRQIQEDRIT